MQLVIEISKEMYEQFKLVQMFPTDKIIANGTPLPEHHGRLIDESDLMPDSDYEDGMFYAVSIGAINGAPTIIEATEVEENDRIHSRQNNRG